MKYVTAMLVLVHQLSGAQIQLPELSPEANTIEQVTPNVPATALSASQSLHKSHCTMPE